jgi:hypothetical protein
MLPVAAIATSFVVVAVPLVLLMVIWTVVTMWRVVFPDDELPFDKGVTRELARRRGEAVPVSLADILEAQRLRPVRPVMPQHSHAQTSDDPDPLGPLHDDLWRRRN